MIRRATAAGLVLGLLAACAPRVAEAPRPGPGPAPVPTPVPAPPAPRPPMSDGSVAALPGWADEDHRAALVAWAAGCHVHPGAPERAVCAAAASLAPVATDDLARAFFETRFTAVPATTADGGPGLLTAYFAPEYPARTTPSAEFDAAVLARPADLVREDGRVLRRTPGGLVPYPDRAAIEAGAIATDILGWMRTEDLFFMQIQGSGYLTFEDGRRVRAAYAADNGKAFVGIARPMSERGLLPRDGTSGEAIRAWLAARRGPEARAVTALNPRYIFFRVEPDDGEPAGAAGVPLIQRRSIAIDPAAWRYGDLVFLDADAGNLRGARRGYRGLVTALDTGSAIRGPVRADFYMGRGDAAGEEAGTVRHPLHMWRLVPR